ncbi:MAG: hypothetical protein BWK79_20025 [Beggiatoa sp. IS2]|nr:MAG: hypothetical protein BWK79_20025 [Beggiatoa sp. IS2]
MIRLALFVVIGSMLWLMGRIACHGAQQTQEESALPSLKEKGQFVRCAYCSTHIPERESIQRGETHFCCEQHRQLYHS